MKDIDNERPLAVPKPPPHRPKGVSRQPAQRSRLTNKIRIPGENGSSARSRRFKDIALALAAEVGGWPALSELMRILIHQAALLSLQIEELSTTMLSDGGTIGQAEQLSRLHNVRRRLSTELRAAAPAPHRMTVGEYIQKKYGND